ncbi:hypothetical protein H5410_064360 [Solanum commersonii]|uniref:Reverse transcriptase n=1 Tax=Solanum commersonii TaxID=4109 RepID=A0A9J5W0B9_SOLCO|nr:hypothetical protein H5410_064360 [Solanum commersonii]
MGHKITRNNHQGETIRNYTSKSSTSRIDRILISLEWNEHFNNIKQTLLQFYHVPLALFVGPRNIQNLISTLKINEQGDLKIQRSKLLCQMEAWTLYLIVESTNRGRISQQSVVLMDYEELHIHEEIARRQRNKGIDKIVSARLDRFLIQKNGIQALGTQGSPSCHHAQSEHNNSYFKFENWWLQTEDFSDRIKNWWKSFYFIGRSDYILTFKLKALKKKLKEWIYKLDEIPNQKLLTEDEITKRFSLSKEFEDIVRHEEIAWRQRSRTLWLKQGDRNTIFFHKTANAHKRVKTLIS